MSGSRSMAEALHGRRFPVGGRQEYITLDANASYAIAHALAAAGFGEVVPPIVQWAVLHDSGNVWNYYQNREAAEAFASDMREVDVEMIVASRNHWPAMYGEWEPVA